MEPPNDYSNSNNETSNWFQRFFSKDKKVNLKKHIAKKNFRLSWILYRRFFFFSLRGGLTGMLFFLFYWGGVGPFKNYY